MNSCSWCGKEMLIPPFIWFDRPFMACSDSCAQKIESYLSKVDLK